MPARYPITLEQEQEICRLYNNHRSTRKVAILTKLSRDYIKKILGENRVTMVGSAEHHKLPVNADFFATLTPASAYFLGLLIADGSVSRSGAGNSTRLSLSLKKEDGYIIEKLRDYIAPQHSIIDDKTQYKLSVGDTPLCLNIVKWGIEWEDKTYFLGKCLTLFDTAKETGNLSHLIRGFLDGDGSLGYYGKDGANTSISWVGTKPFLLQIQSAINQEAGLKVTGGVCNDKRSPFLYCLSYTGKPVVKKIGNWLYKDKRDLYLVRKYEKFMGIVKAG